MSRRQFRVLFRDFLFRIVDRDVLSTYATGDTSQLVLQLVALLVGLSVCFSIPVLTIDTSSPLQVAVMFAWSVEHFMIATTMLGAGILAVFSWDSMYPSARDVFVLGPLPLRPRTILIAKVAALVTSLCLAVVALHVVAGFVWPLGLTVAARPQPVNVLALTMDAAMPPVSAGGLQQVLNRDLAEAVRSGPLAPGAGGGVAIGVFQNGERRIFTYGAASPDSVFPIGSVTKPFTGLALARMAAEKVVGLDEPVRAFLPDARLPPASSDEITLLDLATHRAGLLLPATYRGNPANPFADFDVNRLYAFLQRHGVARPAAPRFAYSNVGFALLGHALANRAGVSYASLIHDNVTGPLGMKDTGTQLSSDQRTRLLQGYDEYRQPVREWTLDVMEAAGGLKSTAGDMLVWLEAHLRPERSGPGALSAALAAAREVRAAPVRGVGIALDWIVNTETGDYQHGGAMAGYTADAFFNPSRDTALIVLSNAGNGTWVSADVIGEHVRARLNGVPAVSLAQATIPGGRSFGAGLRLFAAYWATMLAAGVFIFGLAMSAQGLAGAVLPRRHFLRASSVLQLSAFVVLIASYLLQSFSIRPAALLDAQQGGLFSSSPSYWFLGLLQQLNGSDALAPLAGRAWVGLGVTVLTTVLTYGLFYLRTMGRIAEQADLVPSSKRSLRWPPIAGDAVQAALVRFSVRTLVRSAPHRVILAFYWGIGLAVAVVVVKTPRGQQLAEVSVTASWDETAVPLIVSSLLMTGVAVLAARLAFALPRDLRANWVFRIMPERASARYVAARRRALFAVSGAPVCALSAPVFFWIWPWQPALAHIIAIGLLSLVLIELALSGPQTIPFTRSYMPGKLKAHVAVPVAIAVILPLTIWTAGVERNALQTGMTSAAMIAVLGAALVGVRMFNSWFGAGATPPEFEDDGGEQPTSLSLWDTRLPARKR